MSRLQTYGVISVALAASAISSAWTARANFYATCIHLTRSSTTLMILLNLSLFLSIVIGRGVQKVFFGQLRAIEVEHLYERSWFAVTETCLAMTLFRDQFDVKYLVLFGFLLVVKIFHWLISDRVDYMEQAPSPPTTMFHIKMWTIMLIMIGIDLGVLLYAGEYTTRKGPSMMLIFGFENAIMIYSVVLAMMKYIFHTIDLCSEHPWERKSMYIFYAELVIDLFKLITYFAFFGIIMHYYGFPLHIVRDLYMILRSFVQRCKDLVQYHRATRNMNQRYPNATEQELEATDRVCIICREEMIAATVLARDLNIPAARRENVAKKLGCGHIFHLNCLRSWLERQQSCPTCRRSVLVTAPPAAAATPAAPAPPAADPTLQALQALLQQHQQHLGLLQQQHNQQHNQHQLHHQQQLSAESSTPMVPNATIQTPNVGSSHSFSSPVVPVASEGGAIGDAGRPAETVTPVQPIPLPYVGVPTIQPRDTLPSYSFTLTPLSSTQIPSSTLSSVLDVLSDEELRRLEGRTRQNVMDRLNEIQKVQDQLAVLSVRLAQLMELIPENDHGKGKEPAV
ncbi:E3 ubiquitin-protein ligase synoviolin A-like protein [Obelidium mucronatum]|nr:E3 ubiquitin-protein ligase synoviolin A-like protein [Obelidium mucronatum]